MKLDTAVVRTLLRTEILMLLRDRRTLVLSVVLPLLLMPLMMFGSQIMEKRRQQRLETAEYTFAVTGPAAAEVRPHVDATVARLLRERANDASVLRVREIVVTDGLAALRREQLDFVVEASTAPASPVVPPPGAPRPGDRSAGARETPVPGVPVVTVIKRGESDRSSRAASRWRDALRETRRLERAHLMAEAGLPVAVADVAVVTNANVATEGQVAGLTLGRLLTLMLLMFLLTGGSSVATDSLAGEKERGTLETLLTTAAGRVEIVTAKLLAVLLVALATTVIQVANLLVYVGFKIIPASAGFSAAIHPAATVLILALFLPLAALVASVLLLISGHARTYKEAQFLFLPVFLIGMVPALAAFLPGLKLRSAIAVIPVSNVAVAVKEILTGRFDWPMLVVTFAVNAAAAAWLVRLTVRALSTERLVSPTQTDSVAIVGGAPLFSRHVFRWFAVLWGILILTSGYLGESHIRVQVSVNLLVLFTGTVALILSRYRLEPRTALALRPVKPAVWLAVLIGAPAGLLTGIGVFRVAALVFPVPPQALEAFSKALLPADFPLWQAVIFVAVMPGIFEELLFRGVFLHGLVRRFHPIVAVVAIGAMFGLMHVSLFRLVPTAYLGMLLAGITLVTGSVFPAMLWHFLNNLLGVSSPSLNIPWEAFGPSTYGAAALALALSGWILWRNRTPYPGLRWRAPTSGA
ncbi:MAG TPA: CPBP family glutamic-type intramembrane protease [Vicinamibacterales bacterium]|jgi:sodium transport system permease protein